MRAQFLAAAILVVPRIIGAQTVRGVVVDASNQPVPGVVIALIGSDSLVRARTLSNDRGEFQLGSTAADAYRIRATRIGFRPQLSDLFRLSAGEVTAPRLQLIGVPLALDTIRSVQRATCRMTTRDSVETTWKVWEQVRAALAAGELTSARRALRTRIINYQRTVNARDHQVVNESAVVKDGVVSQPWRSASLETLKRIGYVTRQGDWTVYSGPGLDVLSSDAFLEDHCFRLVTENSTRLGVAFSPTRDRRTVPEIRGTAWLDRKSSELRSVEFGYANVDADVEEYAAGEMRFVRLRDGAWTISRWSITTPVITRVHRGAEGTTTRVSTLNETGGELIAASALGSADTLWAHPALRLVGRALDSASGAPIPNAQISIAGTRLAGTSDAAGYFSIEGLIPGEFVVQVRTPSLDSVGALKRVRLVATDTLPELVVRIPTASQHLANVCKSRQTDEGIVTGTVRLVDGLAPSVPITVSAEWNELRLAGGAVGVVKRLEDTRTDPYGAFALCGVPANTTVILRARAPMLESTATIVKILVGARLTMADLTVNPTTSLSSLVGVVFADSLERPVAGAEVFLPSLGKTTVTNTDGNFRLLDIPPGHHRVRFSKPGLAPLDTSFDVVADQQGRHTIILKRLPAPMAARQEVRNYFLTRRLRYLTVHTTTVAQVVAPAV